MNLAAAVVTIVGGLSLLFRSVETDTGVVLAAFFCVFFPIPWLLLFWQSQRSSRGVRYAEAQVDIHQSVHLLRDAWYSWNVEKSNEGARSRVRDSLKAFASAFSLIAGAHCRACIKVTYVVDNAHPTRKMAVKTYSRSDDTEELVHESGHDWVDDNSDFEELMKANKEPAIRRFLHNDLPYVGYKNSHYTPEEMAEDKMAYRATIVWPIRKRLEGEPNDLLGFLCIDSQKRHAFQNQHDVELGAAYADILYCILRPMLSCEPLSQSPGVKPIGVPDEPQDE